MASRIGNGVESGRHCHVDVASRIWYGVEVDASVMSVWRPESGMEWKWTPPPCWCGVQNRGLSGNGRHCHVGVASKIGNGAEMDATAMFAWRPESGMEWKVDATVMFAWRPESGMEWKWTPLSCLRGVQNREWSGKWTPLSCLRGVQNRG